MRIQRLDVKGFRTETVGLMAHNGCQWRRLRVDASPRMAKTPIFRSLPTRHDKVALLPPTPPPGAVLPLTPQYPCQLCCFRINKPGMWLTTIERTVSVHTVNHQHFFIHYTYEPTS